MRQERSIVVGADGLIGGALAAALRSRGHDVSGTSRRPDAPVPLDLAAVGPSWTAPKDVDVAFLCAAVTSLHACETRPDETRRVNVAGTVAAGRALAEAGAFVVFLSTNMVFDGTRPRQRADEPRAPATEYGRQKAEAETRLLGLGRCAIVRLTKVVPAGMPLFRSWRDALERRETIHPFMDKVMAPVSLEYVVHALQEIGSRRGAGVWQLSADRDISYADAARRIAERLGADPSLVAPASWRGAEAQAAFHPPHTTLDDSRARRELGCVPEDVGDVVCAGAGLSAEDRRDHD